MRKNERNACNAFIEILYKIKGIEYYIESLPEEENRNSQDVEVILAPKDKDERFPKIAVEHTIVEAHDKQIAYGYQSYDIVEKINQICNGKLPKDCYFPLTIPPELARGSKEDIKKLIDEISNWVCDVAEKLRTYQSSSRLYNGYEVCLNCIGSTAELNGKVGRMPTRPENAEEERQSRFRKAIEEKLPKLIKYKEKEKFATGLLLEDVSGVHMHPMDKWFDLIPVKFQSDFQLKIDYVVIFVSNKEKMIVGNVWKEKAQLYSEIPSNRRFSFHQ